MLGRHRLKPFSTRVTSLAGAGAPPPPILASDEVSYFEKAGLSSRSQLWVGTPTNVVTRSDSMSLRAFSGSHRCIITSLSFMPKQESITGTHPVTWNRGTMRMKHGANAPPVPMRSSPLRTPWTVVLHQKPISALTMARWVETAPFGNPVVPDVYRMVASSPGATSTTGNGL